MSWYHPPVVHGNTNNQSGSAADECALMQTGHRWISKNTGTSCASENVHGDVLFQRSLMKTCLSTFSLFSNFLFFIFFVFLRSVGTCKSPDSCGGQ